MAERLELNVCRKLLGAAGAAMSDRAIEQLRDQLYGIASFVIAHQSTEGKPVSKSQQDEIDERAAIMEFDGGLDRNAADNAASLLVLGNRRKRARRTH